jgi:hypothetical protein
MTWYWDHLQWSNLVVRMNSLEIIADNGKQSSTSTVWALNRDAHASSDFVCSLLGAG